MWELLDDRGKDEASAAMKVARAAMNIESGEGKDVVKRRDTAMGVGDNTYLLGSYVPLYFFRVIRVNDRGPT